MRNQLDVFHLAIPCSDLNKALEFYVYGLGCKLARRREDRITLDFFGDQIVCHLDPDSCAIEPKHYPRHFGVTFREKEDFDQLLKVCQQRQLPFLSKVTSRFAGEAEAHHYFAIVDPSNNVLEFKYYDNHRMMY